MLNNLDDLFKNTVWIKPRGLRTLKKDEGLFGKCVERYVQLETKKQGYEKESVKVRYSFLTKEEEELFGVVLINLLFNSDYMHGNELYLILNEVLDLFCMNHKDVIEVFDELAMARVEISGEKEEDFFYISSLFLQSETGFCFNSEDRYYALQINPDFLKACYEVKMEIAH
jgi:hypothetical protein